MARTPEPDFSPDPVGSAALLVHRHPMRFTSWKRRNGSYALQRWNGYYTWVNARYGKYLRYDLREVARYWNARADWAELIESDVKLALAWRGWAYRCTGKQAKEETRLCLERHPAVLTTEQNVIERGYRLSRLHHGYLPPPDSSYTVEQLLQMPQADFNKLTMQPLREYDMDEFLRLPRDASAGKEASQ